MQETEKRKSFTAMEIRDHYESGPGIAKLKTRIIFERLVRYLLKHQQSIAAPDVGIALNILMSGADVLASESEFNRYFYKWMESCSERFCKYYQHIIVNEDNTICTEAYENEIQRKPPRSIQRLRCLQRLQRMRESL